MHDPVALAHVIDDGLLDVRPAHVVVDCSWEAGRGRTNVDTRGRDGAEPNAKVSVGIDNERFLALLLDRVGSLG
jgi:purine nucleosidase